MLLPNQWLPPLQIGPRQDLPRAASQTRLTVLRRPNHALRGAGLLEDGSTFFSARICRFFVDPTLALATVLPTAAVTSICRGAFSLAATSIDAAAFYRAAFAISCDRDRRACGEQAQCGRRDQCSSKVQCLSSPCSLFETWRPAFTGGHVPRFNFMNTTP